MRLKTKSTICFCLAVLCCGLYAGAQAYRPSITGTMQTTFGIGANGELIDCAADDIFDFTRDDAGTVTITASDNNAVAALDILPGGAAAFGLGGALTTAITLTTDGSGDAELVLPLLSVSAGEISDDTVTFAQIADALTPEAGTSIVGADTLGGNPTLPANALGFGTTGLLFEGATGGGANALEGLLTVVDPTADRTWTLPDASGTVAVSATSPATLSAAGDVGIAADSIDATHLADALTPEAGSSIVGADTLGGNPTFAANALGFGTTGLMFEGATGGGANALEGLLTVVDPTADRTWTLPDASGTVAVSATSPATLSAAGDIGIGADTIDATHLADALTPEAGSSIVGADTIGGNPTLAANAIGFGTTGFIFEGATGGGADANEILLTAADPGADATVTIPATTGTLITTGDSGTVSAGMIAADTITMTQIADALTPEAGTTIVGADTLAGDPTFAANALGFGTTGLMFEGATGGGANALEGLLTVVDPTADRTWTLPDASGTVAVSATSPATLSAAGDIGIAADSIDATHLADALTPEAGTTIVGADTLGGNPTFAANAIGFGTTGLMFEGATGGGANALEGLLTVVDPTADRTWTLPDASGTVAVSATSPATLSAAGDVGIGADTVTFDHLADALTPEAGTSVVGADTIGGNPTLAANAIGFGTTGIIFEGATGGGADANETLLTAADPGADVTITIPATTGTLVTTGDTATVTSAMIGVDVIVAADVSDSLCLQEYTMEFDPTEASATNDYIPLVSGATGVIAVQALESSADLYNTSVANAFHTLRVTVNAAPGVGNDPWAVTLRDDAGSTALTCTIDEAATSCTSAGPVAVAANSAMAILISSAGPDADPTAAATMTVTLCRGQ